MIVAGLHVPVMLLLEVVGRAGAVLFWQRGPICVNVGVALLVITILIVAVVAHCPVAGVKVYVVVPGVVVLIVAGFHVPVILLVEAVGSTGAVVLWQSGPICVNVGVTRLDITMLIVVVVAH